MPGPASSLRACVNDRVHVAKGMREWNFAMIAPFYVGND